jgi:hypothetical protein
VPDFEEKFDELLETLRDVAPDPAQAPAGARILGDAVLRHDPDGKLAYHLGSNPDEVTRIAQLDQLAASVEIGKLIATLAKEPEPDEEADAEPAAASKAPPPLTPNRKSAAPCKSCPDNRAPTSCRPTSGWRAGASRGRRSRTLPQSAKRSA